MRFIIDNGVLVKCHASPFRTSYVTIPEEVTVIGKRAFAEEHPYLKRVYLPTQLTAIGDEAFLKCFRLKTIAPPEQKHYKGALLPEGLVRIGDSAFQSCYALKAVTLPSTVQTIGRQAFRGCHALTVLTIPETVQQLGDCLLHDCWSVKRNFDGLTVRFAYENIVLDIVRPDGKTFRFPLPRESAHTFSIMDGVPELLLLKDFSVRINPSVRRELVCRMLESGYLTDAHILSRAEEFFDTVVQDENTDAMRFLLDSGRGIPDVPAALLDRLIQETNRKQQFEMQLLLMEAMKNGRSHPADILKRFEL